MIDTENLENIIAKCGIIKEIKALPESVLGYYYSDEECKIILINDSIKNNSKLYRTVLAEEIGHNMSTIGDITPRRYMCYRDRLIIDKHELLALKWATNFLIPTDKLLEILKISAFICFNELVDLFNVTCVFFMQKLEFMAKQKYEWEIDDNRYLLLHNLPSAFLYEKM